MAVILDIAVQGVQMLAVLLLAPLLTGFVRKVKARLTRRKGASVFQPYRDLRKLLGKEVVLAPNASWLFRITPYMVFAAIWVAAALVPTFASGLMFSWTADLIAITALGRLAEPDDIGPMVASLLDDANRWVTAQRIEASGGQNI